MTAFLIRKFIKQPDQVTNGEVRYAYGRLAGTAGLCANILLFLIKLIAGLLSGSLAIVADAFNNLSDGASSVITLVGFKLSSAPADREHPFGHGRVEYLSAMVVAAMIMVAGYELASASIKKIVNPSTTQFTMLSVVILVAAIGTKLWMAFFYKKIGSIIDSASLRASFADSRNDVICTSVVLVSSIFGMFSGIEIDGFVGIAVAAFVMWSGFSIMKTTVSPLLGQAPDPELVKSIKDTVLENADIIGVHDLIVHNYGPASCVISLHAEVPCHGDLIHSHDVIDCIEKELMVKYHAIVCVHMDPVDTNDERVKALRMLVKNILRELDTQLEMHDFRVVFGETHTNLIFDLVVPFQYKEKESLCTEIQRRVQLVNDQLYTVATVEHSFT